jgi:hypothetical protein
LDTRAPESCAPSVHLEGGRLRTPMGDLALPVEVRAKFDEAGAGRDLIVGIRPEHLRDAALVDADQRAEGLTFSVVVEGLEWLGAEELAYFRVQGARASARELEELAADSGSTDVPAAGDQLVARTAPTSPSEQPAPRWWGLPATSFIAIREESGGVSSIDRQNSVGGDCEVAGASAAGAPGDATARTPDA